jgi:deoxyribodipyrimidine photo-lyase
VAGRDVWLLHPWSLGEACTALPQETVVLGLLVSDFHHAWPWSERRWRFVISRMKELADCTWRSDALTIAQALKSARSVRTTDDPHLQPWLQQLAHCEPAPSLFPAVERRCDSFSAWWRHATHNLHKLC